MAVGFAQGIFTKDNSGTTNATQTITTSFKVKALILYSGNILGAINTYEDGYDFACGISDGTTSICTTVNSEDNKTPSNVGASYQNASIIAFLNHSIIATDLPALTSRATVSFGVSTDFTLTWALNDLTAPIIHYIAIGGDDITNAKVLDFSNPTASGQTTITGVGFQPDFVFITSKARTLTSNINNMLTNMGYMLGMAKSNSKQGVVSLVSEDNRVTTDTWRNLRTNRCIQNNNADTGVMVVDASFNSFSADGMILDWILAAGTVSPYHYAGLFLKGGQWDCGSFVSPNTGSVPQSQTVSSDFTPEGIVIMGHNIILQTDELMVSHNRLSLGSASLANQSCLWNGDTDLLASSISSKISMNNKVLRVATEAGTAASTALKASANLLSVNTTNFILNWDTIDVSSSPYVFLWLAVGNLSIAHNVSFTEDISISDSIIGGRTSGGVFIENVTVGGGSMARRTAIKRTLGETNF